MSETASTMLPLGTLAPDFSLKDTVSGAIVSLQSLKSPTATVVMFICNHCPYVNYIRSELVKLVKHYQSKGIAFIAINSNDIEAYPSDGPDHMRQEALLHHFSFPYLFDETQAVARAYQAACTPDFFVFDAGLRLVYRGRLDEATPGNQKPVTGEDLRTA